jgi:hypothetical protein
MNSKLQELVEFSIKLIDIEIKKYERLANVGVGPDANLSAASVQLQVEELLKALNIMLTTDIVSPLMLKVFAHHLTFYIDCEYLRGRAGWLLDENKIHNTVYERVLSQKKELAEICGHLTDEGHGLDCFLSTFQHQYLYDSHAIAFRILELASKLKEDPERLDLGPDNNLGHGLMIMRNHAREGGRYHQTEVANEISERFNLSLNYMNESPLSKSTTQLSAVQSEKLKTKDRDLFNNILIKFKALAPNSIVFSKNAQWFDVAILDKKTESHLKTNTKFSYVKWGMFGVAAVAACTTAVMMLRNNADEFDDLSESNCL